MAAAIMALSTSTSVMQSRKLKLCVCVCVCVCVVCVCVVCVWTYKGSSSSDSTLRSNGLEVKKAYMFCTTSGQQVKTNKTSFPSKYKRQEEKTIENKWLPAACSRLWYLHVNKNMHIKTDENASAHFNETITNTKHKPHHKNGITGC